MQVHGRYMFMFGIWQASGMYLVYTGNMIPYCHRCGYCRCRPAPVVVAASLTKTLRTRGPGQGSSQLAQPCSSSSCCCSGSSSRNCAFFQPAGCSCCQPGPSRQLLDAEAKETFLESEKIESFLQPCPRPSPHQQCRRPPASAASAT